MKISTSLLAVILLLSAAPLLASDGATLSFYNPRGRFVYYHGPGLVMQAARFETPSPGSVRRITIMMGGTPPAARAFTSSAMKGGSPFRSSSTI